MKGDYSRLTTDARLGYTGTRLQQGRTLLDADWNAQVEIVNAQLRRQAADLIGVGAPAHDAGFEVDVTTGLAFDGGQHLRFELDVPDTPHDALSIETVVRVGTNPSDATILHIASSKFVAELSVQDGVALIASVGTDRLAYHLDAPRERHAVTLVLGPHHFALYVDGVRRGRAPYAEPQDPGVTAMTFGARPKDDGTFERFFDGALFGLRAWRIELDAIRIGPRVELDFVEHEHIIAHWSMHEGGGKRVQDVVGRRDAVFDDTSRPRWIHERSVGAGRYYVDGFEVTNPRATFAPIDLDATLPYLLVLDAWERSVSAYEAPEILEPALNGVDTTTRTIAEWRVRAVPIPAGLDDAGVIEGLATREAPRMRAWLESVNVLDNRLYRVEVHDPGYVAWTPNGAPVPNAIPALIVRPNEGVASIEIDASTEVAPGALLEIFTEEAPVNPEPRRLARLTATKDGLTLTPFAKDLVDQQRAWVRPVATMKWSRDNGAATFLVETVTVGDERLVAQLDVPVEQARYTLAPGDVVELGDDPDRAPPLASIQQIGELDSRRLDLVGEVGASMDPDLASARVLRRWDQKRTPEAIPVVPEATALEMGLRVEFSGDGRLARGDYWTFTTRTNPDRLEWPQDDVGPAWRTPDGVHHYFAPLAQVHCHEDRWHVHDLRTIFGRIHGAGSAPVPRPRPTPAPRPSRGDLAVDGDLDVTGVLRAGRIDGELGPGVVRTEHVADGAITRAKLADGIGFVPSDGFILSTSEAPPAGFERTPWKTDVRGPATWGPITLDRVSQGPLAPVTNLPCASSDLVSVAMVDAALFALATDGRLWTYDAGWRALDPLGTPRSRCTFVTKQRNLHVVGGLEGPTFDQPSTRHDVYCVDTGQWEERCELPLELIDHASVAVRHRLWVFGGRRERPLFGPAEPSRMVIYYEDEDDEWTIGQSLPRARERSAVAVHDGRVFLIGGRDDAGRPLRTVEIFDTDHDRWFARAPLPEARYDACALALDGDVYVVGGRADGEAGARDVYRYEDTTGVWSPVGTSSLVRGTLLHHEGAIVAVGGTSTVPEGVVLKATLHVHRRT